MCVLCGVCCRLSDAVFALFPSLMAKETTIGTAAIEVYLAVQLFEKVLIYRI